MPPESNDAPGGAPAAGAAPSAGPVSAAGPVPSAGAAPSAGPVSAADTVDTRATRAAARAASAPAGAAPLSRAGSDRRPVAPRSWTAGGSTVQDWGYDLLGWAMISFAAGILLSAGIPSVVPGATGVLIAGIALWLGMAVPVALALARSRPRGLLRFRPVDLLYGVVLGGVLRLAQGWFEQAAAGGPVPFPSYPTIDGQLSSSWWFADALAPVVISPVIEEFFFRGVLLVVIYTVVRRALGTRVAAFVAVVVTTGVFVAAHTLNGALGWDDVVSYALVGIVCGMLVLLTRRIWGAVLVHIVFNATWVALATAGTLLS